MVKRNNDCPVLEIPTEWKGHTRQRRIGGVVTVDRSTEQWEEVELDNVERQLCIELLNEVDTNWRIDVNHIKARKPVVCSSSQDFTENHSLSLPSNFFARRRDLQS